MIGIYIRVSTAEQAKEGYSISAQRERLTAFCKAQGYSDYKFYVEEGLSGKNTTRPQLQQLMSDVEAGRIGTILVYKLDRFTRSVLDLHKMLEKMDKHNCVFKSATEPYDTSTAMGRMFITIVAAMAQWEIENSSERIKMALEEKVSKGERVGGIPFGFDLDENEKLIANHQAETVLEMIDKIRSGMSMARLADFLTKTNNDKPRWVANTVRRILTNPALYGATRWGDKVYENTHEGLITKEEFTKLQQLLSDRSQHRLRDVKSTYIFQGVMSCPKCERILSVNRYVRKRSDGSTYQGAIYRCQPCDKEKKSNKAIGEERILNALYEYMQNVSFDNIQLPEPKPNSAKKRLTDIERKREKYQRAWAADLMTDEEFTKLMNETKELYEDLKNEISEPEQVIDIESIKSAVFSFNENFKLLTHDEKREFISRFIRRIDFDLVETPPKDKRSKKGKREVVINNVVFI